MPPLEVLESFSLSRFVPIDRICVFLLFVVRFEKGRERQRVCRKRFAGKRNISKLGERDYTI